MINDSINLDCSYLQDIIQNYINISDPHEQANRLVVVPFLYITKECMATYIYKFKFDFKRAFHFSTLAFKLFTALQNYFKLQLLPEH